jgi:hypothetical protein
MTTLLFIVFMFLMTTAVSFWVGHHPAKKTANKRAA